MAAIDKAFDIKVLRHGSGWKAVHVQVKRWWRPEGYTADDNVIVLTLDATTPEEFDRGVDELIEQLLRLKPKAREALTAR